MPIAERRRREFQRREQEILDAALALFDRDDWQAVTIDDIAARAEVGKGTVYKHFASKDELYGGLALRFHHRLLARLRTLDASATPPEQLAELVRLFWEEYGAVEPGLQRVVDYCDRADFPARLGPALRQRFTDASSEYRSVAHRILRSGIDDGWFARRPLDRMMFLAQSTLMGGIRLRATGCVDAAEDADYRDALVLYMLNGLAEPAGSPFAA